MQLLMKSNGGARGARHLPELEAEAPGRGWVDVRVALPDVRRGYRASLGVPVRDARQSAFGHWRPAGVGPRWSPEVWDDAWIDGGGHVLPFVPTHWWQE